MLVRECDRSGERPISGAEILFIGENAAGNWVLMTSVYIIEFAE